MPLPLTVSCFSNIQIGFTFLVPAYPCSPGKRAVKRVRVCYLFIYLFVFFTSLFVSLFIYFTNVCSNRAAAAAAGGSSQEVDAERTIQAA